MRAPAAVRDGTLAITLEPHELVLVELLEERAREIAQRHHAEAQRHAERVATALESLRAARDEGTPGSWGNASVLRRDGPTLVLRVGAEAEQAAAAGGAA